MISGLQDVRVTLDDVRDVAIKARTEKEYEKLFLLLMVAERQLTDMQIDINKNKQGKNDRVN